jgi:hypothetical protein
LNQNDNLFMFCSKSEFVYWYINTMKVKGTIIVKMSCSDID